MKQICYICESEATMKCSVCNSICCNSHYESIHEPCLIGNIERLSRLN